VVGLVLKTIVQLSLDFIDLNAALETAELAIRAGVDWLEAGTPLILSEGTRGIRELRARYPKVPLVADIKGMDGGYGETKLMAKAGANMITVMGQAHSETFESAVKAARDNGVKIMGDNMNMPDPVEGAKRLQELGCDYIIHHIGYDMRNVRRARGQHAPTPLDHLRDIVAAVQVPVQAVGGLTLEEASRTPEYGAPLVVIGAPIITEGDLETTLRVICEKVHAYGEVKVGK
jgi:3-hexulose-6-phosphate synthase/6-phospho-3-hexuloisomerase